MEKGKWVLLLGMFALFLLGGNTGKDTVYGKEVPWYYENITGYQKLNKGDLVCYTLNLQPVIRSTSKYGKTYEAGRPYVVVPGSDKVKITKITFKPKNKKIIKVSKSGVVSPLKKGTTSLKITVKYKKKRKSYTASTSRTVSVAQEKYKTFFCFKNGKTSCKLTCGLYLLDNLYDINDLVAQTCAASVKGKKLTCTSSNTTTASIGKDGRLSVKKPGKTTLSFTVKYKANTTVKKKKTFTQKLKATVEFKELVKTNDIQTLRRLNKQLKAKGAQGLENDITDLKRYRWDKNGRLTLLIWKNQGKVKDCAITVAGFPELTSIGIGGEHVTGVDVSGVSKLKVLVVEDTKLDSLQLGTGAALSELGFIGNQMERLTVSNYPKLKNFVCRNNQLGSLTVNGCPNLTEFCESEDTKLGSLTVRDCSKLKSLDVSNMNSLTVSGCPKLETLSLSLRQLDHLTVRDCPGLEKLDCAFRNLRSLDIDNCSGLVQLQCRNNQLETLDVSGCPGLENLDCNDNQLKSLNVRGCSKLKTLDCSFNQLDSLVLLDNTQLKTLDCYANDRFMSIFLGRDKKNLDLEIGDRVYLWGEEIANKNLDDVIALAALVNFEEKNQLNLNNTDYYKWNEAGRLEELHATGWGKGGKISLAGLDGLKKVELSKSSITSLDLSRNQELVSVNCSDNSITVLKLGASTLTDLDCSNNQLERLDAGTYPKLARLNCSGNKLNSLNLSGAAALTQLNCAKNQLNALDAGSCAALTQLDCGENPLERLELGGCTALTQLDCHSNQLQSLDTTAFAGLATLDCSGNPLERLDVSKNTALSALSCGSGKLVSLNVSGCASLEKLECNANQLKELDVSKCAGLTSLDCSENQLDRLDLSQNALLKVVKCRQNQSSMRILLYGKLADMETFDSDTEVFTWDAAGKKDVNDLQILVNLTGQIEAIRKSYELDDAEHFTWNEAGRLEKLSIPEWKITGEITLTGLDALKTANVSKNAITRIVAGRNPALTSLNCSSNKITELVWGEENALETLDCENNKIEYMDFSAYTVLKTLKCTFNTSKVIVLSKTADEVSLSKDSGTNVWTSAGTRDKNDIRILTTDVMKSLYTGAGKTYDLGDSEHFIWNEAGRLEELHLNKMGLSGDISFAGLEALKTAELLENTITGVDVKNNSVLEELLLRDNKITGIDVSQNPKLQHLNVRNNKLTELDVTKNPLLQRLYCSGNHLTSLNLSQNPKLRILNCGVNKLTQLDISQNPALTTLYCYKDQFTNLDLSKNPALTTVYCYGNQLTQLDVSKNPVLAALHCYENELTQLDVGANSALKDLQCYGNKLTSLDVSANTALKTLSCDKDVAVTGFSGTVDTR